MAGLLGRSAPLRQRAAARPPAGLCPCTLWLLLCLVSFCCHTPRLLYASVQREEVLYHVIVIYQCIWLDGYTILRCPVQLHSRVLLYPCCYGLPDVGRCKYRTMCGDEACRHAKSGVESCVHADARACVAGQRLASVICWRGGASVTPQGIKSLLVGPIVLVKRGVLALLGRTYGARRAHFLPLFHLRGCHSDQSRSQLVRGGQLQALSMSGAWRRQSRRAERRARRARVGQHQAARWR